MSMSFMAGENITPSRFVKIDATDTGGSILMAGAGDRVIGISQQGTRQPPISGLDDGYAGVADTNAVLVYTENDECWVETGAAVSAFDLLKPSTNGVAITASSDGNYFGALALESATASGQLIRVRVMTGYRGA